MIKKIIREELLKEAFDWDEVLRGQYDDDKYDRLEKEFGECIRHLQEKYSTGENKIGNDSYAVIDVMYQIMDGMFQKL